MFRKSKFLYFSALILIFSFFVSGCAVRSGTTTNASTSAIAKTSAAAVTSAPAAATSVAVTADATATAQQTTAPTAVPTVAPTATPVPTQRVPRTFPDDPDHYPIVTIEMQNGDKIIAELYPHIAPNTVLNFISLINKGFYNGLLFHRVIPGFVIQGGDPLGNGTGNPGYAIDGEFTSNGFTNTLKHLEGVLSMARSSANMNSAGSQFFIMAGTATSLDGNYAAFGKVITGLNIVQKIVSVPRGVNDKPLTDQVMKSVTVDTKGVTYPEPYTNPL
jgi:peptidyl-prolyl cis-trans isomerase B (cyclophilin B)